jgi:serine/threonine protein kinase
MQGRAVIGDRIGSYHITALIGEGGMGMVYAAEHTRIRSLRVAIKCLKRFYAEDETALARFFNEARATMAIRHSNIVEVADVGRLADGRPYLVMELLEGETLARRLTRGRISVPEAIDLARQVTSALAAAHAQGVVHRDLKPENLFLVARPPGEVQRVKILDFGVAKLRNDVPEASLQTRTGSIIGTPAYMSPEQCRGISRQTDGRADIYSLGVILYEMLAGRPPFVGEGGGDVMIMHVRDQPPPLSSVVTGVPGWLEAIIQRALAKSPADRFQRAEELEAALTGQYAAGPAPSAPESPAPGATLSASTTAREQRQVGQPPRRRRYRMVFAAVGLAGLAVTAPLVVSRARALQGQTRMAPALPAAVHPAPGGAEPPLSIATKELPEPAARVDSDPTPTVDRAGTEQPRERRRAARPARPRRQMKPW